MTLSLDRRAILWGDRVAVRDHTSDRTITYAELADQASGMTGFLADVDVGAGDSVVVVSCNRPELLALAWGTWRRQATLAPISQRLPAETIATLCDHIDPTIALTDDRFKDLVPDTVPHASVPTDFDNRDDNSPTELDASPATPRFYLHTGGTTGTPKIVVISNRQVEWNCITEAAAWGLGKHTVSPVLLPMFHTGGWLLLTLPTLYVGGEVVLQREFEPGAALELIETYGATQVFGVAAIFEAMAGHETFDATDFSSVEWFMSGGGPTPDRVMAAYRDRGTTFLQGYGLTEGGPNNLYVDPNHPDANTTTEIVGRPFPDCRIRIVDDTGSTVAFREVGELEISGPITADQYLETRDGTFRGEWVSTGDLAERNKAGDVTIVGRTDNMFVSGGENVYPEPIERTLESHPAVDAVGVIGIPHDRWGNTPKAIVVGDIDRETIAAYAADNLADYEQPHAYTFVESLPRSGPGKLDRQALQAEYSQ